MLQLAVCLTPYIEVSSLKHVINMKFIHEPFSSLVLVFDVRCVWVLTAQLGLDHFTAQLPPGWPQ